MEILTKRVKEKINQGLTLWGFGFYRFTREDKTDKMNRGEIMQVYADLKRTYTARGFDVHSFEYSTSNRKNFAEITVRIL